METMSTSEARERRRDVRLRPMPDLPAEARLLEGDRALGVADVSVGGMAVSMHPELEALEPGSRHVLELDLGRYGTFELTAEVRHRGGDAAGTIGLMFVDPPSDAGTALGRYVAELLERGALS